MPSEEYFLALLITGGTGFLGRYLVSNLLQSNRDIFLLVRRESYQKAENLYKSNPKIHLILGDIRNPKVVESSTVRQRLISETTSIIHTDSHPTPENLFWPYSDHTYIWNKYKVETLLEAQLYP